MFEVKKEPYPIGTWVECIIYEDYSIIGQICAIGQDPQTKDWQYIVRDSEGAPRRPWGGNSVIPLTKLERILL